MGAGSVIVNDNPPNAWCETQWPLLRLHDRAKGTVMTMNQATGSCWIEREDDK